MTEEEWLACDDPTKMLAATAQARTERRLRLLLTHGARLVWDRLTLPALREAIETAERYTEREASPDALRVAKGRVYDISTDRRASPEVSDWFYRDLRENQCAYYFLVLAATTDARMMPMIERQHAWHGAVRAAREYMPGLFRELFGPLPFRPAAFSPEWRTDTALALARQMYESKEFGAMPILADALQDAGCDCEEILSHCRDTSRVHVRGCWVVDLVLGKG